GAQYPNMGHALYQAYPVFRQAIDDCAATLEPYLGFDLRIYLYPNEGNIEDAQEKLRQTSLTQPVLFTLEYALAQQWMAWGIQPKAMIGHSLGEYVAACLSGVFSLADALGLIATRGKMMQECAPGAMISVALSETQLEPYLTDDLSIAAINADGLVVLSGPEQAIEVASQKLRHANIICRRIHTSHAFHSAMMTPVLESFQTVVEALTLYPPQIPFVSNVTGTWITEQEATDPAYWAKQLRQPVRFADGITTLLQKDNLALLEIGPGHTLCTFARQQSAQAKNTTVMASLPSVRDSASTLPALLQGIGSLWMAGFPIDWANLYPGEKRKRLSLPVYPFERQRYWVEPTKSTFNTGKSQPTSAKIADTAKWLYEPSWQRKSASRSDTVDTTHYLLFLDERNVGTQLAETLKIQGHQVTTVTVRPEYGKVTENGFGINPTMPYHYDQLLSDLSHFPTQIIHMWNITGLETESDMTQSFQKYQTLGYDSLLNLTKSLNKRLDQAPVTLTVMANQAQSVTGDEWLIPAKTTTLGLCRVIPQEHQSIRCQTLDLVVPTTNTPAFEHLIQTLLAEVNQKDRDPVIALRGRHRWVQTFEPLSAPDLTDTPLLRSNGTYLITGGLGNIGLVFAQFLAQKVNANLVLIGRSSFPERSTWNTVLNDETSDPRICQKIRQLQTIEANGGNVFLAQADVGDTIAMQQVANQVQAQYGPLNGIIHTAGLIHGDSFRAIDQLEAEHVQQQFQAKIQGLFSLEKMMADLDYPLDFCLLTSSLASILGGLNFGTYAASNAFLDGFAHYMTQVTETVWMSINWDAWTFGQQYGKDNAMGATLAAQAITAPEGAELLDRLFSLRLSQLVVSTSTLQPRLEQWVALKTLYQQPSSKGHNGQRPSESGHSRPALKATYAAPSSEVEEVLAEIWEPLLGLKKVGIHDNFFDLGGHSLLAIQVISRIQDMFEIALPLDHFFDSPTIAKLAVAIEEILIAELDELTDEEALRLAENL
ncbi:MAG: SDR family NAD(P)-dependent oxidoreductase, partial [Chloroflexota bacterium]